MDALTAQFRRMGISQTPLYKYFDVQEFRQQKFTKAGGRRQLPTPCRATRAKKKTQPATQVKLSDAFQKKKTSALGELPQRHL